MDEEFIISPDEETLQAAEQSEQLQEPQDILDTPEEIAQIQDPAVAELNLRHYLTIIQEAQPKLEAAIAVYEALTGEEQSPEQFA